MPQPDTEGAGPESAEGDGPSPYEHWGVLVQTSNVRAAHVANGIVQLMRLAPSGPPGWRGVEPRDYVASAVAALRQGWPDKWDLLPAAHALAVVKNKQGALRLDVEAAAGQPSLMRIGRDHVAKHFAVDGGVLRPDMHRVISAVLNADNKVLESGGSDPTTPGFALVGYTPTHTLAGMHAATFLGALCATDVGCEAFAGLYELVRDIGDSHSSFARALRIESAADGLPATISASSVRDAYPLPSGPGWDAWAQQVGGLTSNLMRWSASGASKPETLMAIVDLASLLLSLRILRWEPQAHRASRVLLAIGAARAGASLGHAIAKAQESLRLAATAVETAAQRLNLLRSPRADAPNLTADDDLRKAKRSPSVHALNLGAAGGWLFPLDSRGGSKRYVRPGPRQLVTLTHALMGPQEEMSWADFASKSLELGLVFGGGREHETERALCIGGVAATLRDVARETREHLVELGLARRESDDVVVVDGGIQ